MARPENRSDARSLSLTLPTETFNYLVLLATLGKLGPHRERGGDAYPRTRGPRDARARFPRGEDPARGDVRSKVGGGTETVCERANATHRQGDADHCRRWVGARNSRHRPSPVSSSGP